MSHISMAELGSVFINDMWGWTDPVSGRDYAILGGSEGIWVIDISRPTEPWIVGKMATHTTAGGDFWRDIKVYKDHAFVGSENSGHGIQILDLTQVRGVAAEDAPVTWTATARYTNGVGNSHNLNINPDTGFLYIVGSGTCSGGLHMVNIQDPVNPVGAGCVSSGGYVHDAHCVIYHGPDVEHRGSEICVNSTPDGADSVTIVDVTDKANPVQLSETVYPTAGYSHQGWFTPHQDYFLHGDELDEAGQGINTRTRVWDVRDLDDPELIGEETNGNTSIDHNIYTKGQVSYHSNYTSGLRIFSNSRVAAGDIEEIAWFDVYPQNDNPSFEGGTWSNYPYFRRQNIVAVSSIDRGFFVLSPKLNRRTD
jgi:choice-of-anchor B domain-containing protein